MNSREHIFPESFKFLMILVGFVIWNIVLFSTFGLWTPALGILFSTVVLVACVKNQPVGAL